MAVPARSISGAVRFAMPVTGALEGADAFTQMADWADWHLGETDLPSDLPATINVAWPDLLLARRPSTGGKRPSRNRCRSTPSPRPSASEHAGKKILIVDDTEMLLIFVADTLATTDPTLQIITASTGAEGIQLAAMAHPELILLDYSLTDMTGDKVCGALLENAATARIPVLMMSGHLSELAQTARNYRNVAAALAKPFLSGALITEVERLLTAWSHCPRHPPPPSPSQPCCLPRNPWPARKIRCPRSPLLSSSRLPEARHLQPSQDDEAETRTDADGRPSRRSWQKARKRHRSSAAPDPFWMSSRRRHQPHPNRRSAEESSGIITFPDVDSLPVEPPKPVEPSVAVPPPVSADTEQEKAEAQPALSSEPMSQSALLSGEPIVAHISLEPEPSNKTPGASSSNGHADDEPAPTPSQAAEEPAVQLARESRETTVFEAQKSVATAKRPAASRTTPIDLIR